ncbi:MAG: DUF21 domain-containing protein [Planctomycetes bacterium]|nr:DUF21 domain-containing protein [Planctomycetota bacterium]
MTSAVIVGYGVLSLLGVVLSALFSGLETGLYTLNRVRLLVRAGRRDRSAMRLHGELEHPNRLLTTLLLGNNIANYLGTFGVAAILNQLGFNALLSVVINAAILIPVLFVLGETLPKDLFRTHTDRWSYAWSGFLVACRRLFTWIGLVPIVQVFGTLVSRVIGSDAALEPTARQRISQLIKEGVGVGVLSESQTTLADRALAMRDRTVSTEMIPWRNVVTLPLDADHPTRRALMRRRDFTRFPVVDAAGRAVGILSLLDALVEPSKPTRQLMTVPMTLEPTMRVREALRTMRSQRQSMAIAVDPSSAHPVGLLTLKDLVEPITGELGAW